MKFILHIKTWNRWRKYSMHGTLFKYMMLFGLSSCPSFEMVRASVQFDYLVERALNKNTYNKVARKILIFITIISLLIMSAIYLNIEDVRATEANTVVTVDTRNVELDIKPKGELFNIIDIYDEEVVKDKLLKKIEEDKKAKELTIEERIENTCNDYGVPFNIVLAIARLETGWFKSDAYLHRNNPGGLSKNEAPIRFNSIEEGVDAFVGNLKRGYFDKGLDNPDAIGKKYCPVDPSWSSKVKSLVKRGV